MGHALNLPDECIGLVLATDKRPLRPGQLRSVLEIRCMLCYHVLVYPRQRGPPISVEVIFWFVQHQCRQHVHRLWFSRAIEKPGSIRQQLTVVRVEIRLGVLEHKEKQRNEHGSQHLDHRRAGKSRGGTDRLNHFGGCVACSYGHRPN